MLKKLLSVFSALALFLFMTEPGHADDQEHPGRKLTAITRNMDAGTDFGYIFKATSFPSLVVAVTATYQEVLNSNIPERADGIAAEIQARNPDLVGLQEVTQILNGPFGGPATNVVADQLNSLMTALANRGLHYQAIAVQTNSDVELPAFASYPNLMDVRLIDHDVVLARTDVPGLKIETVTAQHFNNILVLSFLGKSIPSVRGWIAVDAKLRGRRFRFVNTHLESLYNPIQRAQAFELINGPLVVQDLVVLAGDLNSDALDADTKNNSPAYYELTAAGFIDTWHILKPYDSGATWPLHGEDPQTVVTTPHQRLDFIFSNGISQPIQVEEFGNTASDLTPSGLWPSDHGGVQATFRLRQE